MRKLVLGVSTCGILMSASMAGAATPFVDIAQSYAKQQIQDLYQRGIISGKGQGVYDPTAPITREEFVTMLGRTLGLKPLPSVVPAFTDVPATRWSYPWVQAGNALDIISGTSNTTFAPDDAITREQAAKLLVKAMESNITAGTTAEASVQVPFSDARLTSDWAKPYVYDADRFGLMHGDGGNFRPNAPITREETAVVLSRILEKGVPVSAQPTFEPPIQLGWQFGETDAAFQQKVEASGTINTVSPRWFFLQENYLVKDYGNTAMVDWAHQRGQKIWPLVGNHFNQVLTHLYISQPDKRTKLIQDVLDMATQYDVDGLNIDFEGLVASDRADFTAFIQELSTAAHAKDMQISVDLPPNFKSDFTSAYDYATLAKSADYLVLMGYDEHWNTSPTAGSVSSLPWLKKGIDSFLAAMPASQVIVGVPLYTRDWTVSGGRPLAQELTLPMQSTNLAGATSTWDASVGQYVATYSKSGVAHTIWVEDSRSLALKYSAALDRRVAGMAYWRIGGETSDIWTSLQNVSSYKKETSPTS
ncbi:S-layer homology domain-containing protein [Tumebacillus sp. ITR2]|uniref:S-layer homology domain-containing protein n=1 Tax=Tumebacillus amylolyticus TaxID=2801339 RepID=A0ABS1JEZ7_9BACL|nr:S-layer homology domain-containing protein [Tumebacillus amylolyticus]MBL0388785.1 S-layer homology domain-containing protein [Tumebacillus amylolyticus]